MSLSRNFLREFRPLIRMLEEPFGRSPLLARSNNFGASPLASSFFNNDPFFARGFDSNHFLNAPAVDLAEQGNEFLVEAELPGVKKENIDIRIGDGGQSVTIEGRRSYRSLTSPTVASNAVEGQAAEVKEIPPVSDSASNEGATTQSVTQTNGGGEQQPATQLSAERTFSSASSFSRTVWLPRRVDGSKVKATLEDGILKLRIPKIEDPESVRVNIE